jgi:hypothetical protein
METFCRIIWKHKITNFESFGNWQPISQEKNLLDLIKRMNVEYPDITHKLEKK